MKYDEHHINIIIKSLIDGEGRVRACKKANISYETFTVWMDKTEFAERVKKAEDRGNDKIKDLCKRKIIEDKSWQSGAWWLERNYPKEFGNKNMHIENFGNQIIMLTDNQLSDFTNEELETLGKLGMKKILDGSRN